MDVYCKIHSVCYNKIVKYFYFISSFRLLCLSRGILLRIIKFTRRMNALKHEERGLDAVCEVMERYEKKAVTKANIDAIKFMMTKWNASKDQILEQYSEDEYTEALKELSKK